MKLYKKYMILFSLTLIVNPSLSFGIYLNPDLSTVRVYYTAHILAPDISFIKKIAERWNEKYSNIKGFKVKIIDIDRESLLFHILRSKNPNVDIVLVTNFNIGRLYKYLLRLDFYLNFTNIYPVALNSVRINGNIYAMPFHAVFPILIYRRDFIKEAPQTWTDIFTTISKLKLQNISFPYGIAIYSLEGRHGGVVWQSIVESIIGRKVNFSALMNNASIALNIYRKCIKLNYCDPNMFYYEFFKLNNIYENNKVLMIIQWSYAIKYLLENMSSEYIGIAPLPVVKKGSSPISRLYTVALAVSKFSAHKKESLEFIKYIIKNETNIIIDYGGLPPFETLITNSSENEIIKNLYLIMKKYTKPASNSPMSSYLYEELSKYVKWFLINKNN